MPDEQHGFHWSERQIFQYVCNGSPVYIDPLPVFHAMLDDEDFQGDLSMSRLQAEEAQKDARAATRDIVAWLRKHMNLPGIDPKTGDGMTDLEVMNVLGDFMTFISDHQKKVGEPLKPAPSTEPVSSAAD